MGKILRNYIYNLIYQIIVILVPLITAPYLARVLGPNGTGQYSYVNSMTVLICTVVMLGIYNYGNRQIAYVRDDAEKLNDTFWQIMTARLIIAIFGTVVYALVVFVLGKYQILFLLYYTYLLGYFVDCTWLFVGVEDMKWAVLKNVLIKIMAVIGIFAFVRSEYDVTKYIFIQGSAILIGNLLAYTQIHKYVGRPKLCLEKIRQDIIGSAMLFLPSVAATLYLQCDKIMIELMTDATNQVSFYDYSEKIVMIPLSFITVLSTVMMPRIANEFKKGNSDNISRLISSAAKLSLFIAFPMTTGLICTSGKLIPWYLGAEFLPTIAAIKIISPIIVTNTLSGISGNQYFTATNQISILLKSQIAAAIGNIIMNAILIPLLGFKGAAYATLVSSFFCAFFQYSYLIQQIKLPGLFISSMKYLVSSIFMGVIIVVITGAMKPTAITNLIQIGIGAIVYMIIMVVTKDEQLNQFLSLIKARKK